MFNVNILRHLPIRHKILAAFLVLIGILSVFMLLYFPAKFTQKTLDGILRESNTMTKVLAFSSVVAVEFGDKKIMEEIFQSATVNPNTLFFMIYTKDKSTFYALKEENSLGLERLTPLKPMNYIKDDIYVIVEPIVSSGDILGYLMAGFDLRELKDSRIQDFITILIVTIIMALVCLLGSHFLSRLITIPIDKVIKASQTIALGQYDLTIDASDGAELGHLARNFNSMTNAIRDSRILLIAQNKEIVAKNQAIKSILDNVEDGLVACDRSLRILPGFSRSLSTHFNISETSVLGQNLLDLLAIDERQKDNFSGYYQQIFEKPLFADFSAHQLPRRFDCHGKILNLSASPISDDNPQGDKEIKFVLFCISDITHLERLEEENALNRSIILIMKNLQVFAKLAEDFRAIDLIYENDLSHHQKSIRHHLHTFKGNFGNFGLATLVKEIHDAESLPVIRSEDLKKLIISFDLAIAKFQKIVDLSLHSKNQDYKIRAADFDHLWQAIQTGSISEIKKSADLMLKSIQSTEVGSLLRPLKDRLRVLEQRLYKKATLHLSGEDILIPKAYFGVFQTFVLWLNNAMVHGIEPTGQRGKKSSTGHLQISVETTTQGYFITLSDDGRGLDRELLAQLQSQVSQGHSTNLASVSSVSTGATDDLAGRGVGLAAIIEAVSAAQGSLAFKSEPGSGLVLEISLPSVQPQQERLTA